jgi:hypothetical protein
MNKKTKYYIDKSNKVKEMVFISQDTDKLYLLIPKRQKADELKVNSILITSLPWIETIVKKKIEMKLDKYVKVIQMLDDDDTNNGTTSRILLDAEKFRMKLINEYIKFLGKGYRNLAMEKLDVIINELRERTQYKDYVVTSERGRRGR